MSSLFATFRHLETAYSNVLMEKVINKEQLFLSFYLDAFEGDSRCSSAVAAIRSGEMMSKLKFSSTGTRLSADAARIKSASSSNYPSLTGFTM